MITAGRNYIIYYVINYVINYVNTMPVFYSLMSFNLISRIAPVVL